MEYNFKEMEDFEKKFKTINEKINLVFIKINENYEKDVQILKSDQNSYLEKNINDYRQILLNKLHTKRDEHLNEVNNLAKNPDENFVNKINSIKTGYLNFKTFKVLNEFIFKSVYKFKQVLDQLQILKYSKFIFIKKAVNLNLPITQYKFHNETEKSFLIMPNNEIFIPLYDKQSNVLEKMVIIDKDGNLKNSLNFKKLFQHLYTHSFKVNISNIIHSYTAMNKAFEYTVIQFYNYDLQEVYSVKFMDSRFSSLILNNHELFSGSITQADRRKLLIFNVINLSSAFINYQTSEAKNSFYIGEYDNIVHVNSEKIYYTHEGKSLRLLNRSDGVQTEEIKFKFEKNNFIKFDEQSRIYIYEGLQKKSNISVYDSFGKKLISLAFNPIFKNLCLSSKGTYIAKQNITANKIEYEEF